MKQTMGTTNTKDESVELVQRMVNTQLSNNERLVITLRAGGMRWDKIAELLGVQRNQLNIIYRAARDKLKAGV